MNAKLDDNTMVPGLNPNHNVLALDLDYITRVRYALFTARTPNICTIGG